MGHQGTLPHYVSGKVRLGGLCCRFPRWYQTVSGGAIPWSEVSPAGFIRLQKGPLAVSCIFNGAYIQDCDMLKSIMQVNISLTSTEGLTGCMGWEISVYVFCFFYTLKSHKRLEVSWRRVYFIYLHLISQTLKSNLKSWTWNSCKKKKEKKKNCDINYIAQNIE